jgi:hypothetical protein
MYNILAQKTSNEAASIFQMPVKRWWMDETYEKHAYNCFPVTLTNRLGWGISFPEDISFIWNGISDSSDSNVKILSGHKYVTLQRGNATVSFNANIKFKTKEDLSLLVMPPSNYFINGATCFTTIISTSFFDGPMPIVYRITEPNKIITIKANDPVCTILPISLTELQDSEIMFTEIPSIEKTAMDIVGEENARAEIYSKGEWTHFYKNAVNWKGEKVGDHEVKSIRLKVI